MADVPLTPAHLDLEAPVWLSSSYMLDRLSSPRQPVELSWPRRACLTSTWPYRICLRLSIPASHIARRRSGRHRAPCTTSESDGRSFPSRRLPPPLPLSVLLTTMSIEHVKSPLARTAVVTRHRPLVGSGRDGQSVRRATLVLALKARMHAPGILKARTPLAHAPSTPATARMLRASSAAA